MPKKATELSISTVKDTANVLITQQEMVNGANKNVLRRSPVADMIEHFVSKSYFKKLPQVYSGLLSDITDEQSVRFCNAENSTDMPEGETRGYVLTLRPTKSGPSWTQYFISFSGNIYHRRNHNGEGYPVDETGKAIWTQINTLHEETENVIEALTALIERVEKIEPMTATMYTGTFAADITEQSLFFCMSTSGGGSAVTVDLPEGETSGYVLTLKQPKYTPDSTAPDTYTQYFLTRTKGRIYGRLNYQGGGYSTWTRYNTTAAETEAFATKDDLYRYNSYNVLPMPEGKVIAFEDLTVQIDGEQYTFNTPDGPTEAARTIILAGGKTEMPDGIKTGNTYHIDIVNKNNIYMFVVMAYWVGESFNDSTKFNQSFDFTVPENATGLSIRLYCVAGRTFNNDTMTIRIPSEPTNAELRRRVNAAEEDAACLHSLHRENLIDDLLGVHTSGGVTVTGSIGGYYHIFTNESGATDLCRINLAGGSSSIPPKLQPGKSYVVRYDNPDDCKMTVQVYAVVNGASVQVMGSIFYSDMFTVPSNATGLYIRFYSVASRNFYNNGNGYDVRVQVFEKHDVDNPPMISIIDDDGHIDYYNILLPFCEEHHIPIASAVIHDRTETPDGYHMTWAQVQDAYARGAEILSHTKSHTDQNTDVTDDIPDEPSQVAALARNYMISRNGLSLHGVDCHGILVYNHSTAKMRISREAASRVFDCAIHTGERRNNYAEGVNPYFIQRYSIANETYGSYNWEYLEQLVDNTAANGGWCIMMIHTSNADSWGFDHGATAMAALAHLKEYADGHGVPIVPVYAGVNAYIKGRSYDEFERR